MRSPRDGDPIDAKLDKLLHTHSPMHHELFDEDTDQVGSLGDLVEKHAGDAVFLAPSEPGVGGADGGLADWEAEMLETDPSENAGMDADDLYSAADEQEGMPAADLTGTVAGIARGFGTHLPQDLGADGYQVEELPDIALAQRPPLTADGELSDYDDNEDNGPDDPDPALARASQPGVNAVAPAPNDSDADTDGHRLPVKDRPARSADDQLDATRKIR